MRYSIDLEKDVMQKAMDFYVLLETLAHMQLNNKYGQKLVDGAKKSATDAFKSARKIVIQKTAEATGDQVGNTIANKITSISKNPAFEPI